MNAKVLVGCPTSNYHEYCLDEYSEIVKNLTYDNYDILLVDNSKDIFYLQKLKKKGLNAVKSDYYENAKKRIITSRNLLRENFLEKDYDYLLSLEQDIIPPRNVIEILLSSKKEIVSGVYFMPQGKGLIPMLAVSKGEGKYIYLPFDYVDKNSHLLNVNYSGLGCLLISRNVLEKVKFRIDKTPGFDDWFFCKDAEKQGFEIYAHLGIKCKHLLKNRPWNWSQLKL